MKHQREELFCLGVRQKHSVRKKRMVCRQLSDQPLEFLTNSTPELLVGMVPLRTKRMAGRSQQNPFPETAPMFCEEVHLHVQ